MDVATRHGNAEYRVASTRRSVQPADTPAVPRAWSATALYGARAWAVYWLVEGIFLVMVPWLIEPAYDYRRPHPGLNALLLAIYLAFGLILGGILGWALEISQKRKLAAPYSDGSLSAAGTLTLVVGFAANYVIHLLHGEVTGRRDIYCLAICALVAGAVLVALRPESRVRRLRPLTNAWSASLVLLAAPWTFSKLDGVTWPSLLKALLVTVAVAAVIAGAWVVDLFAAEASRGSRKMRREGVFLGVAVLVMTGMNLILRQRPLESPAPTGAYAAGSHPNIVLITLDTVRADHLSVYGYQRDTTPNLRKFAREATLYTRVTSSGDMTLSSHASLFTGLYPSRHGAHFVTGKDTNNQVFLRINDLRIPLSSGAALDSSIPTLAEILSQKGYATIGVIANIAYLRHNYGLDRGFQYYSQSDPVLFLASGADLYYVRDGICALLQQFSSPSEYERAYRRAGEINAEAFEKLKQAQSTGRPFFLFLNYMDAHEMYFPPHPFDTLYPGKDDHLHTGQYLKEADEVLALRRSYPPEDRIRDISQYDGGIAYLDYEVGKLISRLKSMRLYDNTILVITSDHGQAFGERNLILHCSSVYQDQVHVPLLIHFPGQSDGRVVERRLGGVDLMPTLLDAAGFPVPSGLDGRSFYRTGQGSETVFSESYPDNYKVFLNRRFNRIERAIFDRRYKFISSTIGKRELYDLSIDPNETHNLYHPDDNISRELEVELTEWIRSHTKAAGRTVKPDQGLRERLKSLGYVQ
jgi:arylsulfatase A-like enzyme